LLDRQIGFSLIWLTGYSGRHIAAWLLPPMTDLRSVSAAVAAKVAAAAAEEGLARVELTDLVQQVWIAEGACIGQVRDGLRGGGDHPVADPGGLGYRDPQAETGEGRKDSLDPDAFKYKITSRELGA